MSNDEYLACEKFVDWLDRVVVRAARGDLETRLDVEPEGKFWLGRLAPEDAVVSRAMGERGERIDPCAVGMVLQPATFPCAFDVRIRCRFWRRYSRGDWRKSDLVEVCVSISLDECSNAETTWGGDRIREALRSIAKEGGLQAEIRVEWQTNVTGCDELAVTLVNTSPEESATWADTNLYECSLAVEGLDTRPFLLEALPDSFRYDRKVAGYGINCGVVIEKKNLRTDDSVAVCRGRPTYWNAKAAPPDLRFATLANDPLPSLASLITALEEWGTSAWGSATLDDRAELEAWSAEMRTEATGASDEFRAELSRLRGGLTILRNDATLRRAFQLMNRAMIRSSRGRYEEWRPFQIGFLLANIRSLVETDETDVADIVWFATGGGKTETYLAIVVTAAFFDRLRGKAAGITAWNRFPLRMLSLQQTQRFADALAAAELVRLAEKIPGDPFSVGFFVGQAATPNRFDANPKEGQPDLDTSDGKYLVLLRCPFCHGPSITTRANHAAWTLDHRCGAPDCPWGDKPIPFYVVDDEVYRFLPTVVIGTLDKAASIAVQSGMRGFIGQPWGLCSKPGHGYTYATRSTRRTGCLVPDCPGSVSPLAQAADLFPPTLRLQDELHLLKDSLGAVDAHYESLLDSLQSKLSGRRAKVLGSSATLAGYEKQIDVLYQRKARVFPAAGPRATEGFWTSESSTLARRFVALGPRGVTVEYAVDRAVTELQRAIRRLLEQPELVCREAEIDVKYASKLVELYGVDVVYGNTIRDLDATVRSFETQIAVNGRLNTATLTGRTPFDEVKCTLDRLEKPETSFEERIHLVAASAMMSHGVDIDRLNVMVIVGLPLTTAEFIQTSARVGRRYPGLVIVLPKMARERDASVFRSFEHFVRQGDRFVEPVPIGRRSRRVLARTIAGLFFARLQHIHEPASGMALTTIPNLRRYMSTGALVPTTEAQAIVELLGFSAEMDSDLRDDVTRWCDEFFANVVTPPSGAKFPSDLAPDRPMMSLRDVEEQVPIFGLEAQ